MEIGVRYLAEDCRDNGACGVAYPSCPVYLNSKLPPDIHVEGSPEYVPHPCSVIHIPKGPKPDIIYIRMPYTTT